MKLAAYLHSKHSNLKRVNGSNLDMLQKLEEASNKNKISFFLLSFLVIKLDKLIKH